MPSALSLGTRDAGSRSDQCSVFCTGSKERVPGKNWGCVRGQSEAVVTSVLGPALPGTLSCAHLRERLFLSVWCLCLSVTVLFPRGSFVIPVGSSPVPGVSVKRKNDQVKSLCGFLAGVY